MKASSLFKRLPYEGWILGGVLLNSVLSYAPMPLLPKLWIGLIGFGLFIPSLAGLTPGSEKRSSVSLFSLPSFSALPLVVFLILAAFFLRFGWLVSFHGWPLADEGLSGFAALDLSRHWRWDLSVSWQSPPLFFWLEALFFKALPVNLTMIWLFPALVSTATLLSVYASSRQWFDRRTALWATMLWGISFWPAEIGRYNHMIGLVLFWETAVLGFWGWWRKRPSPLRSILFGLWIGFGFWTYLHWPLVVLLLLLVVGKDILRPGEGKFRAAAYGSIGALIGLSPLLLSPFSSVSFRYIASLLAGTAHFSPLQSLVEGGAYVASILWSGGNFQISYRPYWGGFLNPILVTLALAGLIRVWKAASKSTAWFLTGGVFLGVLPGFLTRLTEFFRTAHAVPFFLLLSLAGLATLLEIIPTHRRVAVLSLVLATSAGLDLGHLAVARRQAAHPERPWAYSSTRSLGQARAFRILEACARKNGKGWVFTNLANPFEDGSLGLACVPFNLQGSDKNITAGPASVRWAALFLDRNFAMALQKEDPQGLVFEVEKDKPEGDRSALFLRIWPRPPTEAEFSRLRRWMAADHAFETVRRETIAHQEGTRHLDVLKAIQDAQTVFAGDPVLASWYWLCVADFWRDHVVMSFYHPDLTVTGDPVAHRREWLQLEITALRQSLDAFRTEPALSRLKDAEADQRSFQEK